MSIDRGCMAVTELQSIISTFICSSIAFRASKIILTEQNVVEIFYTFTLY